MLKACTTERFEYPYQVHTREEGQTSKRNASEDFFQTFRWAWKWVPVTDISLQKFNKGSRHAVFPSLRLKDILKIANIKVFG